MRTPPPRLCASATPLRNSPTQNRPIKGTYRIDASLKAVQYMAYFRLASLSRRGWIGENPAHASFIVSVTAFASEALLLCQPACRERSCCGRTAEQRHELAPLHRANPKTQGSWDYSRSGARIAAAL